VIEVADLHKSYGSVRAVRGISFRVERGTVSGFLGPNGAGKSTTLRILAGFLAATSGQVRIGGHDIDRERMQAVRSIGYMPETSPLYPEMRTEEYLRFRAELKGVPRKERKAEIGRVLERAGVADVADTRIGALSKGYRQRVGLADALLGSPPLLILDEPTAGLDPNQIGQVRALIGELREAHTVLLSTHILSEVEAICDRAIVIHRGQLVAEGAIDELRRGRTSRVVACLIRRPEGLGPKALTARLEALASVTAAQLERQGDHDRLEVSLGEADDAIEQVVFALAEARVGVRRVEPVAASLEQVFADLTREATEVEAEESAS
jgi:ABC-2 type transport system ATP-binding protein